MKLYRYRSPTVNTLTEIATQTVWHSRFSELNDPFEATFQVPSGENVIPETGNLRVCCFSAVWNNALMWSHYTDSHRGICLEYEVPASEIGASTFAVEYSLSVPVIGKQTRFPPTTPGNDLATSFFAVLLTKSSYWAYEEEYRTISYNSDSLSKGQSVKPPGQLTGVYFGMRTAPQFISTVNAILQSKKEIPFRKCKLSQNDFSIRFDPIERDEL